MKYLSEGVELAGKIAVADFICPTVATREAFNADYTVWMDTISRGRFEDTNDMFETPEGVDYHIEDWFNDAHEQLLNIVRRFIEIKNV
jgi:adenylylsulfate kinase